LDDIEAPQQLSYVTIAYAVMFYIAASVLILGLLARVMIWVRRRHEIRPRRSDVHGPLGLLLDLALFRGKFFDDRVSWIFSVMFHYGLLSILFRHLRYALEPEWVGPLWRLIIIAQPVGLYGGLLLIAGVLGFWARRLLAPSVRATSTPADHAMLALLLAIPVIGYFNSWVHTDLIAVKQFFLGLVSFKWQPLPADPLLLLHVWLAAALMMVLPFSKLLHLGGVFEPLPEGDASRPNLRRLARWGVAALVVLTLAVPAATGTVQVAAEGWTKAQPDFSKLARAHKAADPTVMIRSHPNFLMNYRSVVVYRGARQEGDNIEKCVTCHVVKGADGLPVGFEDPKHFCRECHNKAAVSIDCFECHNSNPTAPPKTTSIDPRQRLAVNTADVAEGSAAR